MDASTFPHTLTLVDGSTVTLRPLAAGDEAALAAFVAGLTADDLLFLREDVTDPTVIAAWARGADSSIKMVLVAEREGVLVGEALLRRRASSWARHVGEVHVIVAASERRRGLGTLLAREIFLQALRLGLEKIIAEMTVDQSGAIAVFEKLGFRGEGLLTGYAQDRSGRRRDLIIMAHDVSAFTNEMAAYGFPESLGEG